MSSLEADFPEPLDDDARGHPADTDDLISRLADEAIDRMIAEDEDATTTAKPTATDAVTLDAMFDPPPPVDATAPTTANALPSQAIVAGDEPAAEVAAPPHRRATDAQPAPEAVPVVAEPAVVETIPAPEPVPQAAAAPALDLPPPPAADVRALLADAPQVGVPFLLRPLEWLNAPFARLPDHIKSALGQIGILTLLNAAAVIAYVLLFRRHR